MSCNSMDANVGISGYWKLTTIKPDGTKKVCGEFKNLILDAGLDALGKSRVHEYCRVGTSNLAVNSSQNSLVSQIASTNTLQGSTNGAQSTAPYYGWRRITYRFNIGVAAGNLSEIGIGWSSTGSTLFSRALILDGLGNPTTITVASDEILDATYEMRIYPPTTDVTGTITLDGVSHTYIIRACEVNNSDHWNISRQDDNWSYNTLLYVWANFFTGPSVGIASGRPTGDLSNSSTCIVDPYTVNREATGTIKAGVNDANNALGIGTVTFGLSGILRNKFQLSFTPNIMKNNTKALSLQVKLTWGRV